jgi:hypothetical protein
MFELRKLNVHRIVATKEEKAQLLSQGYEEVKEVSKEVIKVEEVKKEGKKGKA